ncbi:MAG: DUF3604 domain-containing protein [Deltaproteobacteria bacterium]|nr:DUF3604 domain-containing protein [Deltaproteobacteria bacterium]
MALAWLACGLGIAMVAGCSGEHQAPGVTTDAAIPGSAVKARAERQAIVGEAMAVEDRKQILFGDLHTHTTFSPDAFMVSLPMMGGSGLHPPADACDFARFCADLDFWSINDHAEGVSPRHWSETIDSIQECNARAGDPADPDSVAFLGWEWTQVGGTPETHYGHKNVVLLETDRARVPRRPIAAPRPEFRVAALPAVSRTLLSLVYFRDRQLFADYQTYYEEVNAVAPCPEGVDTLELPADCHEVAANPRELNERLDRWDTPSLLIPHGTTWGLMTPRGFSLARELASGQHDAERQRLFEIYSGHGSAEELRELPGAFAIGEDALVCPEPTPDFLPCCWQAGEIIRDRCERESHPDCEARAAEARSIYLAAGAAGHLTVPGAGVDDWLDCDQCRDCFAPAFSPRPGGSAQAALAMRSAAPDGEVRAYRFGLIGASDTHDARPGNGFKEFSRVENTEAPTRSGLMSLVTGDRREPAARAEPTRLEEVPLAGRRDIERGASFFMTGGLAAVHAESRQRESIWSAMSQREVYATSGERILLWFDLLSGPEGRHPMGSIITGQSGDPRFHVTAVGAFEQKPGCPDFVRGALGPERLEALCLGECYHPSDRRRSIRRLEVVRIRPRPASEEDLDSLVDDPWRVFECDDRGEGCRAEFTDSEFAALDGEVVYYARAVQEPTLAVNAGGFRCRYDEAGRCVEIDPCYADDRTAQDDDCLAEIEERAWSSPIFVSPD